MLNLFYEEPDGDRWFFGDRYPRRLVRRIVRGRPPIGGQKRVFLNLCAGLDRIGQPYRVNDYRYLRRHPDELACVVGKPHVLDKMRGANPILFGSAIFSHPVDDPDLFRRLPVRLMLVPGEWVRRMHAPFYGDRVVVWPTGVDVDLWQPTDDVGKDLDVLLYDKIRWEHERFVKTLIGPIENLLASRKLRFESIRYGHYRENDFRQLLGRSRAMIFLCEHESQGFAYLQALSCGVPILAWDRGGEWQDPTYYPHHERFGPVTSVPYWDQRCGLKFADSLEFSQRFEDFWAGVLGRRFRPRDYVVENLTLEGCSRQYVELAGRVLSEA